MSKGPTLKIKNRLNRVVIFFILLGFSTLIGRLFYLSVIQNDFFQTKASNQQMRDITINANRGTIYDRNMKVLAQSATVWTVFISPADLNAIKSETKREETRNLIAENLSEILEVDKEKVVTQSKKSNYYEIIKKKVEEPEADKVREFAKTYDISCIHLIEDTKRYYPYHDFASSVIGFTGTDNQGLYGIEAKYDSYLSGTAGRIVAAKNENGTDMPFTYEKRYEPQDGNGLVLTLDYSIQYFLEKALETTVKQYKPANRAAGIVMNVNTGEILAMASEPDFDLNEPFTIADPDLAATLEGLEGDELKTATAAARERQWKNKAITEIYEPGSVFKAVTASAALEEKLFNLNSTFHCTGSIIPAAGVKPMKCHKTTGHGTQNFGDIIVNSCNPAFVKIGQTLGANLFSKYVRSFGFAEKTGIDLPGEAKGIVYSQSSDYGPVQLASCAFGQSNTVTPIQMITAFAAVVNDGKLVTPHVVKKVLDENNNVVKNIETTVKRQVISSETSETMRPLLEAVVAANGGSNAYVKGYRIGGKSGTAQKLGDTTNTKRIGSYCTFAPVDDPEIIALVLVDEPTVGNNAYGSVVAGPALGSIMADALPYLGVEPQYTEEELAQQDVSVSNYVGWDILKAQNDIKNKQLTPDVRGNGTKVIKQTPAKGTSIPKNGKVILYTEEDSSDTKVTVPNLVGETPARANTILTNLHLNIKLTGGASGAAGAKIYSQSIAAGTQVSIGTVIELECRIPDELG